MPSLAAIVRNLREPMSLREKLAIVRRHAWVRVRHAQTCCDHPGSPGC